MSKRILIVDDDLLISKVVSQILARIGGYETRVENKAETALSVALEFRPDLVVLDYQMPTMTGAEVLSTLRTHPSIGFLPAILLSGDHSWNPMSPDEITLFLRKPATGDALVKAARSLLEGRDPVPAAG
jgi:CheY-like chemotaxis protein